MQPEGIAGYRADIDGLRAVSVLGVILYHLGGAVLPGGFAGVDVFFVISGYLITSIIARESDEGRFSFLRFYERRIRRIFPALMLVLAVTVLVAWFVLLPSDFGEFGRVLAWTPAFASNFVLMDDLDYFSPLANTKVLLHTWSLSVEEQFYLVFPWLLIVPRRVGLDRRWLVAGITALSLAASIGAALTGSAKSFFLLPTRFWELGAGALLALYLPVLSDRQRNAAGIVGLGLVLGAFAVLDDEMMVPGWAVIAPVLGASCIIVGFGSVANRLLAMPPLVFIGQISYPMYLWHWPIIVFSLYVLGRPISLSGGAAVLAATIVASWLTLIFVEAPIRTRRWFPRQRSLILAAASISVVFVLFGASFRIGGGFPSRFPPEDRATFAIAKASPLAGLTCGGKLSDDFPEATHCFLGRAETLRPTFAVLGDSHAWAMASSISREAARHDLKGIYLGRPGCSVMWGVDRGGHRRWNCAARLRAAIDRIIAEDIPLVILIARWASMLPPTSEETGAPRIAYTKVEIDGRMIGSQEIESVVRERLGATLDRLTGRRVLILANIPEQPFHPPYTVVRARHLPMTLPVPMSRHFYEARQAPFRELLNVLLAGREGVEVLETADLMCPEGVCHYLRDGELLYRDPDHLSLMGGDWVSTLFRPAFHRIAGVRTLSQETLGP